MNETPPSAPPTFPFSHSAMTTTFEVLIVGQERNYARQVAQTIFQEIDHFEGLLSRFNHISEIGQINFLKPGESLPVGLDVFECLAIAEWVHRQTRGAFDITVGPLVNCWRDDAGRNRTPSDEELEAARALVGMDRLLLLNNETRLGQEPNPSEDEAEPSEKEDDFVVETVVPFINFEAGDFTVGRVESPDSEEPAGMIEVDLGGIGKGFVMDKSLRIFNDWDISSAMIHSTSTVLPLGSSGKANPNFPDKQGWTLGIGGDWLKDGQDDTVMLSGKALSGSGTELKGRHIIDPRTGKPASGHLATWASCPSATIADALSTAFMVMSTEEVEDYCRRHPETSALLVSKGPSEPLITRFGEWG